MPQTTPVGILPFSSTDPSIILKCSLLSAASVAAPAVGPAGVITGTGHTFGAEGFHPAPTGNTGIAFTNITGHPDLDKAGQISFEIDKNTICAQRTDYGSVGHTPGGPEYILTWNNDTVNGYLRKANSTNFIYKIHDSDTTIGVVLLHSQHKSTYARLTISWVGTEVSIYVDGYKVTPNIATARVVFAVGMFKNINVLSFAGAISPSRVSYMRNLIVSSAPVNYPVRPDLSTICIFGHSFANSSCTDNNTTSNLDGNMFHLLRKYLANDYGVLPGFLYSGGIGGGYVDTALIADANFHIITKVPAALALSPQVIVILAGTNDVNATAFNAANFELAYHNLISDLFLGTNGLNIKRIIVTTVQSVNGLSGLNTPTIHANILAANVAINALPAWLAAADPTLAGKLVVSDLFTAWGGADPVEAVMIGQLLGTLLDLHPSPLGGDKIMKYISKELAKL